MTAPERVFAVPYDLPLGRGRTIGRSMNRLLDLAIGGTGFFQVRTSPPVAGAVGARASPPK